MAFVYEKRPTIIIYDFDLPAQKVLRRILEVSYDTGTISGYGTEESGTYAGYFYIEDTTKSWTTDVWKNLIFEDIDAGVVAKIVGNSSTRLYLDRDISANISTGDRYRIGPFGTVSVITQINSPLTDTGNVAIGIAEDLIGLAKESTLSSINSKIVKVDTDNVTIVSPLTGNGNIKVGIAEDLVGLLKTTDIPKTGNGNISVSIEEAGIQVPVDVQSFLVNRYKQLWNADETAAQSITLDTEGCKLLEVYAKASTATTFHLDVSCDNSNWIEDYMTWSSVTEVKETLWCGFRYVRLRSDAAGASGDTVTLILSAKP